ncbi:MAG: acyloxyacyl hydrolase [Alphaproteobacteria bacterium]|nr:MAG: acyloxyacyl hydrolase [Alphaproteobacteria bacterium]
MFRSSPPDAGKAASASMPSWPSAPRCRCSAAPFGRCWAAASRPTCRRAGPISTCAGNGRDRCSFSPSADELYYSSPGHKALGSRVLFHIPLEIGVQVTPNNRVALYYEHASNGFTAYPNPGLDNIGLRLAHRF